MKKGTNLLHRKCIVLKKKKKTSFTSFLSIFDQREVCFFLQTSTILLLSSLTKESIIYFRELGYLQAFAILKCIFKIHSDSKPNSSSTAKIFILFCFVCSHICENDQLWKAKLYQLLKNSKVLYNWLCFVVVIKTASGGLYWTLAWHWYGKQSLQW